MVVTRVFGNDATVGFAGTQGNFQLNVFTPVMAHAVLESVRLLSDACRSFTEHCVVGLEADREKIAQNLEADLMLVTALAATTPRHPSRSRRTTTARPCVRPLSHRATSTTRTMTVSSTRRP